MSQPRLPRLEPTAVLVTGSRLWTDRVALEGELTAEVHDILVRCHLFVLRSSDPEAYLRHTQGRVRFVLGDCPDGADHLARQWCEKHAVRHERFLVDVDVVRVDPVAAFHDRNRRMVREGKPDRFLAFWDARDPKDGDASGTLDTMKRCVRARIPGRIIPM